MKKRNEGNLPIVSVLDIQINLFYPESIVWGFFVPNGETDDTKGESKTPPSVTQLMKNKPGN